MRALQKNLVELPGDTDIVAPIETGFSTWCVTGNGVGRQVVCQVAEFESDTGARFQYGVGHGGQPKQTDVDAADTLLAVTLDHDTFAVRTALVCTQVMRSVQRIEKTNVLNGLFKRAL